MRRAKVKSADRDFLALLAFIGITGGVIAGSISSNPVLDAVVAITNMTNGLVVWIVYEFTTVEK